MSTNHDAEHETSVRDFFLAGRARSDPEVAELVAACPSCATRLDELERTAERVEAAGREQRAELLEAAKLDSAPGEERVAGVLERLAEEEPHASPPQPELRSASPSAAPASPSRRWQTPLLAAAAVLLVAFVIRRVLQEPEETVHLGHGAPELVAPVAAVSDYGTFRWTYDGPRGGSFVLRIWDALLGAGSAPILEVDRIEAAEWTPTPEGRERLPERILWEVEALDAFGVPLAVSPRVFSSRSP